MGEYPVEPIQELYNFSYDYGETVKLFYLYSNNNICVTQRNDFKETQIRLKDGQEDMYILNMEYKRHKN